MPENTDQSNLGNEHQTVSQSADQSEDKEKRFFPSALPAAIFMEEYYSKHEELRDMAPSVIRGAWFTTAHILLQNGASILNIGCGTGETTYAMAALQPHYKFTGIDTNKDKIKAAKQKFKLPNLTFKHGTLTDSKKFPDEKYDGVINAFILHEIYSQSSHSDQAVIDHLKQSLRVLKENGRMFIQSYTTPPPEEYVLIELPDTPSEGEDLDELSLADLLIWYSEHARPNNEGGYDGFFLEELPARMPQTRLFRAPFKWTYEFILRKDDRASFEKDTDKQLTFFTRQEFRKHLRALGSRVNYTAPYYNEQIIKKQFEGKFRLYNNEGKRLSYPETSYVAVTQKTKSGRSLQLHERRPSKEDQGYLNIYAMRNTETNKLHDIVTRGMEYTDVLPYRVEDGNLYLYVHENLPRGISSAIPRGGRALDGKIWSGHLTEAVSVPTGELAEIEATGEYKDLALYFSNTLGLKITPDSKLEKAPSYLPAPDFIDERVHTRFIEVADQTKIIKPKRVNDDIDGFTSIGTLKEVSAQHLLNALAVGFIPNARLEMQVETLYSKLGLEYESWGQCPLKLELDIPEHTITAEELIAELEKEDNRFEKVKGTAGDVIKLQSMFVDEGYVDGGMKGLKSRDMEFAISDDKTMNMAVVLPLTRHAQSEEVMMGIVTEFLPVPQRYKGSGMSISAPSYKLPSSVRNMEDAKYFIAEEFKVTPEKVSPLGPSYFCHVGITPLRIFPFAVAASRAGQTPFGGPVSFIPTEQLYEILRLFDRNLYFSGLATLNGMRKVLMYGADDNEGHQFDWTAGREKYHGFSPKGTIQSDGVSTLNHITATLAERAGDLDIEQATSKDFSSRQGDKSSVKITNEFPDAAQDPYEEESSPDSDDMDSNLAVKRDYDIS